jgi:preprotein translocase subunit SecY
VTSRNAVLRDCHLLRRCTAQAQNVPDTHRQRYSATQTLPIPDDVSTPLFLVVFFFVGGLLALWVDARLAERGPSSLRSLFVFIAAGLLALRLATSAAATTIEPDRPMLTIVVLFGIVLPTLVYVFLTTIWLLKVVRSAMPR